METHFFIFTRGIHLEKLKLFDIHGMELKDDSVELSSKVFYHPAKLKIGIKPIGHRRFLLFLPGVA